MVFKLTGGIIVILSCSFIGMILAMDISKRPQEIKELRTMLQMLENRITYLSDVITDAFGRIADVCDSNVGAFFTRTIEILETGEAISASEAWEQAVKQCIRKTSLNSEDESILLAFGKQLGNTDLDGQVNNIRLTLEQLKIQEEKAEESRARNEKIYRSLGVLGGIAAVIVLL